MNLRHILPRLVMVGLVCIGRPAAKAAGAQQHRTLPSPVAGKAVDNAVCARVNGRAIYVEELRQACQSFWTTTNRLPEPERTNQLKECTRRQLEQLIERELLVQAATEELKPDPVSLTKRWQEASEAFDRHWARMKDAMRKGGLEPTEAQMREVLRSQGFTVQMFRRKATHEWMARSYLEKQVGSRLELSKEGEDPRKQHQTQAAAMKRVYDRVMPELKRKAKIEIFEEAMRKPAEGIPHSPSQGPLDRKRR